MSVIFFLFGVLIYYRGSKPVNFSNDLINHSLIEWIGLIAALAFVSVIEIWVIERLLGRKAKKLRLAFRYALRDVIKKPLV
jgi:hypothetical protein